MAPQRRGDDVAALTDDVVALHSSDPATVYLSVLSRMRNPSIEAIDRALYGDRSVIRHHAMRRTLWVMTPTVARLAHGAATAKVARAERRRTVGAILDSTDIADPDLWLDTALAEIIDLLAHHGPLTTRSIGQELPHLTIPVRFGVRTKHPASLKAHTKVLQGAGFDATLMRAAPTGSWNTAEYLWTPTQDWVGESLAGMAEEPAAIELLDRWLRRFGPATENDIKWWFGWTAKLTGTALAAIEAVPVELDDGSGYVAADDHAEIDDPGPWVRLLPGLDPTAMGWKDRDWYVDPRRAPRLFDRWGNVGPTVWVDGEMVGGWVQTADGEIAVEVSTDLTTVHKKLLQEAIDELSAALGDVIVRPRFPAPVQKDLSAP